MTQRITKINPHIQDILSGLFTKELSLKPGVFLTIVKVDTSKDLRYARVFVSAFPNEEKGYALQTLLHEKSRLQKELHKKLSTKILPKISFILDETESHADEVERLFQIIKKEK
jgi:ribosome-binding factor A